MENRTVLFLNELVKEGGEYVPCIAEENTTGYYKTDWLFGSDKEAAQQLCDEHNERNGIDHLEAMMIQATTMRKAS